MSGRVEFYNFSLDNEVYDRVMSGLNIGTTGIYGLSTNIPIPSFTISPDTNGISSPLNRDLGFSYESVLAAQERRTAAADFLASQTSTTTLTVTDAMHAAAVREGQTGPCVAAPSLGAVSSLALLRYRKILMTLGGVVVMACPLGCRPREQSFNFTVDVEGSYVCNVGQNSNANLYLREFGITIPGNSNIMTIDDENAFFVIHDGRMRGVRYPILPHSPPDEGCTVLK